MCNNEGVFAYKGTADPVDLYLEFTHNSLEDKFAYGTQTVLPQTFTNVAWSILYLYDKSPPEGYGTMAAYFLIPLVGLMILAVFIAKLITTRLYKPIEEVMEVYLDGEPAKGLDEFQMLRKKMQI